MKYHIKFNCHDWPHRGDMSRREVMVEAGDDAEVMALGMIQASQTWPGAKLKIYDCAKDRIAAFEEAQARTTLRSLEDEAATKMQARVDELQSVSREIPPLREPVPHQVTQRNKLGLRST